MTWHFISGLMAQGVPFVVTELGADVDPFVPHAVRRARREGARDHLPPDPGRAGRRQGAAATSSAASGPRLLQGHAARPAARAQALRPVLEELSGMSARAIAAGELNQRGIATARGKPWTAMTVDTACSATGAAHHESAVAKMTIRHGRQRLNKIAVIRWPR